MGLTIEDFFEQLREPIHEAHIYIDPELTNYGILELKQFTLSDRSYGTVNIRDPVFVFGEDGRIGFEGVELKRFLYGTGHGRSPWIEPNFSRLIDYMQIFGSESPKMQ